MQLNLYELLKGYRICLSHYKHRIPTTNLDHKCLVAITAKTIMVRMTSIYHQVTIHFQSYCSVFVPSYWNAPGTSPLSLVIYKGQQKKQKTTEKSSCNTHTIMVLTGLYLLGSTAAWANYLSNSISACISDLHLLYFFKLPQEI